MMLTELDDLIVEIKKWIEIRGGVIVMWPGGGSTKHAKPMETLPWVLGALHDYRSLLVLHPRLGKLGEPVSEEPKGKDSEWSSAEILDKEG